MTAAVCTAEAIDRANARTELDADYTPRYIQAAHRVRTRITDGTYARWSCIPGSSELATELGVSRSVMLHGLDDEGHAPRGVPRSGHWEPFPAHAVDR